MSVEISYFIYSYILVLPDVNLSGLLVVLVQFPDEDGIVVQGHVQDVDSHVVSYLLQSRRPSFSYIKKVVLSKSALILTFALTSELDVDTPLDAPVAGYDKGDEADAIVHGDEVRREQNVSHL